MIGVSGFVLRVKRIAARGLTYRIGGVGKDGTCDCIGLIMGAMCELGHRAYPMHCTNYFARYQMQELEKVTQRDLQIGMILFKARSSTGQLHTRYQSGGRYFTGDLQDYYHVGVVTGVNPLEITECTEYGKASGIVVSGSLKGWQYGGRLKDVLYEGSDDAVEMDAEMASVNEDQVECSEAGRAIVATQSGALNVRAWPKTGEILGKLPKGKEVELLQDNGDGWPRIRYGELDGYASTEYLQIVQPPVIRKRTTMLIKDDGTLLELEGIWRVAED
ncbi:MAG: SH3 domain-containing protein [Clostridia bacterium]|nr:SH3 domain-containing protein [Clostridia bacterium]